MSFKVTPPTLMTEFSVFILLQGTAPGNSSLGGRFFKGLQNYMENKNEGNENKIILRDFNCTMDKMDKYGGNKTQRLYRCCSNYTLLVDNGFRIYGEGTTQIPLS